MGDLGGGENRQGPAPRPSVLPGSTWPLRGARRQRPARATWPFKGRWLGPPATPLAYPRFFGDPSREGGLAQRLLPFISTFLPPLSPSVVVLARAPSLVPASTAAPPALPGAKFCRRGTVTVLCPKSAPFFSRGKKKVAMNVF